MNLFLSGNIIEKKKFSTGETTLILSFLIQDRVVSAGTLRSKTSVNEADSVFDGLLSFSNVFFGQLIS